MNQMFALFFSTVLAAEKKLVMEKALNGNASGEMKRLLRRRISQQYFNGCGWTADPEEAKNFSDIIEVAQACTQHGLSGVEVVLRVGRSELFCTSLC